MNESRMTSEDMDDLLRFKGDNYSLTLAQWERANPPDNDPFWTMALNAGGASPLTTSDMRNPMKKVIALNHAMKKLGPDEPKRARHQTLIEGFQKSLTRDL